MGCDSDAQGERTSPSQGQGAGITRYQQAQQHHRHGESGAVGGIVGVGAGRAVPLVSARGTRAVEPMVNTEPASLSPEQDKGRCAVRVHGAPR